MKELTTEAKVGLLAIVVILALVWVSQRIADTPSGGQSKGIAYYTTLDSAEGISAKTPVEIAGVSVGEVEDVTREGTRARVKLRIRPDVQLPLDSRIVVKGKGILGDKVITIQPGAAEEGPMLREGEEIRPGPPEADLDQIIKRVDAIAQDVQAITGSVRQAVGTAEGQQKLQQMVDDLSKFADNLNKMTTDNREALNEIVENMRVMSERLNQVIDHSGNDLDETFADVKKAASKLDASLASIQSVTGKIDRGEGTIGRLVNDEETVDNLNDAIGGINDLVSRINRIHIFVNYEGEFQIDRADGQTGLYKNQLMFRIQPHEDYGYYIGLSDDPDGKITKQSTHTVIKDANGNVLSDTTTSEVKSQDTYLFTAQFAKRWGHVGARIGLKESSGGIGADAWALGDKLKLSLDAYQFDREKKGDPGGPENPRIKIGARYDVVSHLFVVGGVDDMISRHDRRAIYAGAGFEFNDDDLKFLLGSVPTSGL